MINHVWTINSLKYSGVGNLAKVVNQISWDCYSDDGAGHVTGRSGITQADPPNPVDFTTYNLLTEHAVVSWLGDEFIAEIEAMNEKALQALIDAEVTNTGTGVPW